MIYATPRSGRIVSGAKTRRQAKLGSDVLVELEPTYPQNINWIFNLLEHGRTHSVPHEHCLPQSSLLPKETTGM
jgi:hypothetical protein